MRRSPSPEFPARSSGSRFVIDVANTEGPGPTEPKDDDLARRRSRVGFALVALGAVALDQVGKVWAVARLGSEPGRIDPLGPVHLQLSRNPGAGFGIAPGLTAWITAVALVAVVALTIFGWRARSRLTAAALGLAAGGAAGNAVDRILRSPGPFRGAVVDWIKVPFYGPVFNVADVALRAGLLVAVVVVLRSGGKTRSVAD